MIGWLKKLFGTPPKKDPLWEAMEKMDRLLAYDRFRSLELTGQQRPVVKGLIDGTVKPGDLPAVARWCQTEGERPDGIAALVYALQDVLGSSKVTYLFEHDSPVPAARFPHLVDAGSLTVLFNDRASQSHLQITSLEEFLSANQIGRHSLETLDLNQLQQRVTGRAGKQAASATGDEPAEEAPPQQVKQWRKWVATTGNVTTGNLSKNYCPIRTKTVIGDLTDG